MENFDFFFGLHLSHRVYSHTNIVPKALQNQKMPACSSKRVIELTLKALTNLRYEEFFNMLYDTTVKKAKEYNFVKDPSKPRKRKAPKYSILQYFDGAE